MTSMEGLRDSILSWLAEEFDVSSEQPPANAPIDWVLKATTKGALKIVVVVQKPKGRESVVLTLGLALHKGHLNALSSLGERERVEVAAGLVRRLIGMCPDCLVVPQPNVNSMKAILVTRILYPDRITKSEVLSSTRLLANMALYATLYLNEKLGTPTQKGSPGEGYML